MSEPDKKPKRKSRLFPRTLDEVVKQATKPLMDKQGKLYGALLRDWTIIVGTERARITQPQRLQFQQKDAGGAILHLDVRPSAAPELSYVTDQMLEQCARYFGYRAIERIVLHPNYEFASAEEEAIGAAEPPPMSYKPAPALPADISPEMRAVLERIGSHVGVVKKPSTR
jgi:hypothetical protein